MLILSLFVCLAKREGEKEKCKNPRKTIAFRGKFAYKFATNYLLQKFDYRLLNFQSLIVTMLDSDTFLRFIPEKQRISAVFRCTRL